MRASLLFQLHSYRLDEDVPAPRHFEEAYTTEHDMVRIFKVLDVSAESRAYCDEHRRYPPALDSILAQLTAFKQN